MKARARCLAPVFAGVIAQAQANAEAAVVLAAAASLVLTI